MQNLYRTGNTWSPLMLRCIHKTSRKTSPDENNHLHFKNVGILLTGGFVQKSYERWIVSRNYSSFIYKWGLSSGFGGKSRKLKPFFLYDLLYNKPWVSDAVPPRRCWTQQRAGGEPGSFLLILNNQLHRCYQRADKKDQLLYVVVRFFIRCSMGSGLCVWEREREEEGEGGAVLRYILLYLEFSSFQINIVLLSSSSQLLCKSVCSSQLQGSWC